MLEGYVIAEVSDILVKATEEVRGSRVLGEELVHFNKFSRILLPKLDEYFKHRLGVSRLETEKATLEARLEKVQDDKSSNDKDYFNLRAENTSQKEEIDLYKKLLKRIVG